MCFGMPKRHKGGGVMEALAAILRKLSDLERKEDEHFMSITDQLTQENADLTALGAELDAIAKGITELDALIASLKTSGSTLSASDQALLDQASALTSSLKAKAAAISTAPPA